MLLKLKDAYGEWQQHLMHLPKSHRFTLGAKIDGAFLDCIELTFIASYANSNEKIQSLERAVTKFDLLKLLVQLSWEVRVLDNNKYHQLGEQLNEIGKMLGGWRRRLSNKNSSAKTEENQ